MEQEEPRAQQPRPLQDAEALRQAAWHALALQAQVLLEDRLLRDKLHVQLQVGGLEDVQLSTAPKPEGAAAPLVSEMSSRPLWPFWRECQNCRQGQQAAVFPNAGASLPSMRRRGPGQQVCEPSPKARARKSESWLKPER